jgi:hypothetical protein
MLPGCCVDVWPVIVYVCQFGDETRLSVKTGLNCCASPASDPLVITKRCSESSSLRAITAMTSTIQNPSAVEVRVAVVLLAVDPRHAGHPKREATRRIHASLLDVNTS